MSYTIEVAERGTFIRVTVSANVTVEMARAWTSELIEMTHNSGVNRYLTDVREVKNVSTIPDNYYYSHRDVPGMELDKACRSAILVSPDDHSHDLIEITLNNAGYNVKIFHDEIKAIKWLET